MTRIYNDNTPDLSTCMRHPVQHYRDRKAQLWALHLGLKWAVLDKDGRTFFSRNSDPEMREADEALLVALTERPDFAAEMQVPAELFRGTFTMESACAQLERSATDLLSSLVDSTLVCRHSAYMMNGEVEIVVQQMSTAAGTPWHVGQDLHVRWTEVSLLERLRQDQAAAALQSQGALDRETAAHLDRMALTEQDLQDLGLLDEELQKLAGDGTAAAPRPALPQAPKTGNKNKTLH